MTRIICALFFVTALAGCNGNHGNKGLNQKRIKTTNDSITQLRKKLIDSAMAAGDRPDSEQGDPTFEEVLAERLASYNKVENIDKVVIDGSDTLQLHETYYCLHDSSLIVPKHYVWGGDTTKDFVTHNFATKVVVINNKDTMLNRIFRKIDFNKTLFEQLKKYAIIFDAGYIGYNKQKGEFALHYSISIPLTDVGVPAYIMVDKRGNYRVLDQYTKIDAYKRIKY